VGVGGWWVEVSRSACAPLLRLNLQQTARTNQAGLAAGKEGVGQGLREGGSEGEVG